MNICTKSKYKKQERRFRKYLEHLDLLTHQMCGEDEVSAITVGGDTRARGLEVCVCASVCEKHIRSRERERRKNKETQLFLPESLPTYLLCEHHPSHSQRDVQRPENQFEHKHKIR